MIVIDIQREYFKEGGAAFVASGATIVPNVNQLISGFRKADKPIFFIRHMNRASGADAGRMGDFSAPDEEDSFIEGTPEVEFIPELDVVADDIVVVKRRYSSFVGTELDGLLRTARVRAVVVVGLMTSFCCESTARDAHARDYEVLFVADANEGPDLMDESGRTIGHDVVLRSTITALSAGFAEVVATTEVLNRLKFN